MVKRAKSTTAGKGPEKAAAPARGHAHNNAVFPIVGIGASAGGLEALEKFLGQVPAGSGMAFVIIQHLDPTHKGMMSELLQRATAMKVLQAGNRMKIVPNRVYVIPPNSDLSILHGTLYLFEPVAPRGHRLPIDFFFRALAEDQREQSIGIILSGMGSDGTLGLRAIKEKAGLVLVQSPDSARFDGMPSSAIDAGVADIVAAAEDLPRKLIDYIGHAPHGMQGESGPESPAQKSALDKICILIREHAGHDFSRYKKSAMYRRIERRMGLHQLKSISQYVRYLQENPQEIDLLFKELLIGVTSFFRDPEAWSRLQEKELPILLADCPPGKVMRAWVVGCSTGEEAYSLAMIFRETLERASLRKRPALQIFATDLDKEAIDQARQGLYPVNITADVSPERLSRFFTEEGNGYRLGNEIREMVVFAAQNVIMDPPFTKLDILCCRNLLIYLDRELQKELLQLFHYCLNPGGILFLGSSESIGEFTDLFAPLENKARLFRRSEGPVQAQNMVFPSRHFPNRPRMVSGESGETPSTDNLQTLTDQLLLQHFSPAALLVNGEGDILYINGHTGKYLEPAAGKVNWNVYAMARQGLQHELALALPGAVRNRKTVTFRGLAVDNNGSRQMVDLTVHGIDMPKALRGMALIVFTDVAAPVPGPATSGILAHSGKRRLAELEQALKLAHAELLTSRNEMQTQQEELKSTNEELQSTNEELQSTNEELTTSKEELQSLNEELQTLNSELQSKVDELSLANSDMQNLLNSTDIATVFLDDQLHVRRFTEQATEIFKLIPGDVGRPLSDLVSDLDYSGLQEDALEVMRTLAFSEKQIATHDGRWFSVRIMPYRTLQNVIDGVVITFTNITTAKTLEAKLRRTNSE
ncbi:MAG: chemotaxis protein CheB [Candidatus Promineifilaceae bacterium]